MRKITKRPKESTLTQKGKLLWVLVIFNAITLSCFILVKQYTLLLMTFIVNSVIIVFIIGNFNKFKGKISGKEISTEMEK